MELSDRQKQDLIGNGYVQFPGLVPRELGVAALKKINNSLGQGIDPEQIRKFRLQSYCPEVQDSPAIMDLLYESPIWGLAESLIGSGQIRRVQKGQIALRFPTLAENPTAPGPHIDGLYMPGNGVPENELASFTALVGVLLSDLPTDNAGNFTVWPGTHRLYEEYFQRDGIDRLFGGVGAGMPPVPLPTPVQICGNACDVVLCHYQLAHAVALNLSPHIRYAVFFRLSHLDHQAHKLEALTDIWHAWPGIRADCQGQ